MFPLDKILDEKEFKEMDVVVCGHSLGGAIASIVAIKLFIGMKRLLQERSVKCITFGAPLFGDSDSQNYVAGHMSSSIHHFVCVNDPIPNLLRYTHSILPWLQDINNCLSENTRSKLVTIKRSYSNVIEPIDRVMRMVGPAVNVASLIYPNSSALKKFQDVFRLICDVNKAIKENVYIPIGNFHFLSENFNGNDSFSCDRLKELEEYMQVKYQQNASHVSPDSHSLSHYTDLFRKHGILHFGNYPFHIEVYRETEKITPIDRVIRFKDPFKPLIYSVELTQAKGEKSFLKLSFKGKNLFGVVLDRCQFDFDFPFANKKENVKIKNLSMGENIERLVIEEETDDRSIAVSDHGIRLLIVTQFGECEKILRRENVRDIVVESVRQIAENDSVSLVVRRAIQRGMALRKIKTDNNCIMNDNCNSSEQIIDEIIKLGTVAIGNDKMKRKEKEIFTEYVEKIDFVFTNEESFRNVKDLSDKIEEYIRSPLVIEAGWTAIQKIGVGFSVIAGAAIAGFIASRSRVSIGVPESNSTELIFVGGAAGAFAAGATATSLINEQLTDSNYKNALNFIVQELFKAQQNFLSAEATAAITDLRDEDNFFSKEKALIRLIESFELGNKKLECFEGCIISKSTDASKEGVVKRIKAIKSINKIREIFSQQCFIGVVGLQDAGKTTLIKKIWNVGEESGYFNHTNRPEIFQITQKLLVVDFPGSNSLHDYSKTFSICGVMNNMVIVVIPFFGDASEIHSQEIANVFGVMKGSDSTRVILCINKCGLYLNKLREDLVSQEKPADFLKQNFTDKLNDHYERKKLPVRVKKADIFFTDWELKRSQESVGFGIIGVEEIKKLIKDYLVDNDIYKSSEEDELQKCVSFFSN